MLPCVLCVPCTLSVQRSNTTYLEGVMSCLGAEAKDYNVHGTSLIFSISQQPNVANLTINDIGGGSVISFGVEQGKLTQSLVFGESVEEGDSMVRLQESEEYRILPALASLLGTQYNVTARQWPISMLLYRLAMSSEVWHKTDEKAVKSLQEKHLKLRKRSTAKSSSMIIDGIQSMVGYWASEVNPWTYDPQQEVLCPSPDGVCDERVVKHAKCVANGLPLESSDIKAGCMGLCGPHCFRCWSYICGDCCKHPGCYSHDSKCLDGYLSLECVTGKGLLWGDNTEIC